MGQKRLKSSEKASSVSRHLLRRSPRFNPLARLPQLPQEVPSISSLKDQGIPRRSPRFNSLANSLQSPLGINKWNDVQKNINCLPEEILIRIFENLTKNEFGRIARVCKRWFEVVKYPVLWKKVDVSFHSRHKSQNVVAGKLFENLPSCVTHLKLDFQDFKWKNPLIFEEFCEKLGRKCPSLKALILHNAEFSVNLQSALDLSKQCIPNLEIISFHYGTFTDYSIKVKHDNLAKIKVLDLYFNFRDTYKLALSDLSSLKKLNLFHTKVNTSWFTEDTSFLQNLEVLNVCVAFRFDSMFFQTLQSCALKLTELYLCRTNVEDSDISICSSGFPQLKSVCLKECKDVTCEGVVILVHSCKSLQNLYVDTNVAENYERHPFVVANNSKLQLVKTTDRCQHLVPINYLYEQ